jgi:hypothetical protein
MVLLFEDKFGDVLINHKFRVNRYIMSKKSSVFKNLFKDFSQEFQYLQNFEIDVIDDELFAYGLSLYVYKKTPKNIFLDDGLLNVNKIKLFFDIMDKFDFNFVWHNICDYSIIAKTLCHTDKKDPINIILLYWSHNANYIHHFKIDNKISHKILIRLNKCLHYEHYEQKYERYLKKIHKCKFKIIDDLLDYFDYDKDLDMILNILFDDCKDSKYHITNKTCREILRVMPDVLGEIEHFIQPNTMKFLLAYYHDCINNNFADYMNNYIFGEDEREEIEKNEN